jgi:hypothetical protein
MLGGFAEPAIERGAAGIVQISCATVDEPFAGFFVDLGVDL